MTPSASVMDVVGGLTDTYSRPAQSQITLKYEVGASEKTSMRKIQGVLAAESRDLNPEADLYADDQPTATKGRMAGNGGGAAQAENANRPEDRINARAKLAANYGRITGRPPLPPVIS